ncbi:MAG: hypothetical protein AAGD07_24910 [Planctomycetota bacterium]
MSQTHIVVIHGLASKPPEATLHERYRRHLSESLPNEFPEAQFHTVYWADLMGYSPPDGPEEDEYQEDGENFQSYSFFEETKFLLGGLLRSKSADFVEAKMSEAMQNPKLHATAIGSIIDSLPAHLAGKPARRLYDRFLPDLHRYFFGNRRNDVLSRLTAKLESIPENAHVCLIAHSMGSIIALDAIVSGRPINTLITIGSPLGITVVQEQLGLDSAAKESLATKVGHWFNLYDRLDVVALDNDLADDFEPMIVNDIRVRNFFVNKDGERNHHKSYGYLRTPELGGIVQELL